MLAWTLRSFSWGYCTIIFAYAGTKGQMRRNVANLPILLSA
jgi:hypothetical protein